MVTDTEQREREVSQVAEASSRLGEIEGQVKLLVRRTEENARNAREDYRILDGKIDRSVKDLGDKIDRTAKDLSDKIDQTAAEIRADMRAEMRDMRAEMRRQHYWVLGIGGVIVAAIIIERFVS